MEPMTLSAFIIKHCHGLATKITTSVTRNGEAVIFVTGDDQEVACWLEKEGVLVWCELQNGKWILPSGA